MDLVLVFCILHELANAIHALKHGNRPLAELLQRGLLSAGQRVLRMHDGMHGLARRTACGDMTVGGRVVDQADLGSILANAAHDLGRAVDFQRDADARILLAKIANGSVDQLLRKALATDHADTAAVQPAQRIDLGQHVVAVGRVFAVIVQQQLAGFGGHHAAAVALQQGNAQFLFEQADLAADGRGHDA